MTSTPLPRTFLGWFPYLFTHTLFPGSPDPDRRVRPISLLVILLLPAAILYPTLGFHLLEPDEGRYAQIPKEMLERGEWVVPTLQGEPYLDKPPLMYWLIALSYRVFGVSPESARLVPAVCVHLTILAVYLLGRRSIGERAAFWAAVLLSVAPGFACVARLLVLDGLLVLCVTLSVVCGFEAVRTGRFKPSWWVGAAAASGLGFLTKGPISEVLLFVPLWAFGFLASGGREAPESTHPSTTGSPGLGGLTPPARRNGVRWFHYALFFAVVAGVNVPWYAAMYLREPEFLKHFFWEHNVLRFLQPFDHLQPVWYYVPILLAGLLPGTLLLAAYGWKLLAGGPDDAERRSSAGGFWLLAGGWCVFFFSCSGSKLPTYILPAYPFLCLALGEFVARSRWNTAASTRLAVGAMACLVLFVHHVGVPWYAKERSPFGRPDLVGRFVTDPDTTVVCFPRNCDSLAFYTGRSDFAPVPTKETNQLMVACHHRPRTVILFTHSDSLAGFRNTLPPSLEIVEAVSLKRKYGGSALDKLFGSTPWGLCDVAVVVPKGRPGAAGDPGASAKRGD
ncbi:MAG: glycosyltransferase family 39 protein [Gemmataceae bacterium]|nr:glycosyltransferase family 39 protein [Gemmataceae bacterium]